MVDVGYATLGLSIGSANISAFDRDYVQERLKHSEPWHRLLMKLFIYFIHLVDLFTVTLLTLF